MGGPLHCVGRDFPEPLVATALVGGAMSTAGLAAVSRSMAFEEALGRVDLGFRHWLQKKQFASFIGRTCGMRRTSTSWRLRFANRCSSWVPPAR